VAGPTAAASGPSTAYPMTPMPYAGKSVSELTRASRSGGICCCKVVLLKALEVADPAPQAKAPNATQGAAACRAIGMSGSA
jgi:hypothetical protein